MTAPTVETITSELLSAPPVLPTPVATLLLRALDLVERPADPEFTESVDRKLTENYEAWCLRYFGTTS